MLTTADPAALDILRRAMVVRLATLSRSGRPSITPIYFTVQQGHIWIGTVEWTLAARSALANPHVSLLFSNERDPRARQTLRITGTATVRTDAATVRAYNIGVALKYILVPGGIWSYLSNANRLPYLHGYHAQNEHRGGACIIDVAPEQLELLPSAPPL